jgi:hypothetical protein
MLDRDHVLVALIGVLVIDVMSVIHASPFVLCFSQYTIFFDKKQHARKKEMRYKDIFATMI